MPALRFLGSGDAFGSGGRFQTCIGLSGGRGNVLIDCGATSLTAMKRFSVDPSSISVVLISHLHGDHFGGLPFLVLDGQFSRRQSDLLIAGPPGIGARTLGAMEVLFPGSSTVQRRFGVGFVELEPGIPAAIGPATVTAHPVVHASGAPSYGLRVEYESRTVAYSGDTEWTEELIKLADGSDVFVCEAYMFERQVKFHLEYATLRSNLGRLNCKRLVLTHMSRDMLERASEVELEMARDGLEIIL